MLEFLRITYLIFFITHIPITLIIDSQIIFGKFYPTILQNLYKWHYVTHNDILLADPPNWLISIVATELLFQVPFFFFGIYCLIYKKNSIRIPGIIYSAHVSTTLVPILYEILSSDKLNEDQRLLLSGFYTPYLIIPLIFGLNLAFSSKPLSK